jgi:hypothetical protein
LIDLSGLVDGFIPGEQFGRLKSLMSDHLSPQLKQEGRFQVLCGAGSGLRTQADDLSTGPSLSNPLLGIGWNDQFPIVSLDGPVALVRAEKQQVARNERCADMRGAKI